MNCPNCKNPIQQNTTECEWCGSQILKTNTKIKKKFNGIVIIIPGIVFLFWWILYEVGQDKGIRFNDDGCLFLYIGLSFIAIGLFIKNRRNNEK